MRRSVCIQSNHCSVPGREVYARGLCRPGGALKFLNRTFPPIVLLLSAALPPVASAQSNSARAVFSQINYQFGKALAGAVLEHDFALKNEGDAPLRIFRVQMASPLIVTAMPISVAPGMEAYIRVKLDTSTLRGRFPGEIQVVLNDPALPVADLSFEGEIVPRVEFLPAPAFFLGTHRGEARQASIEIINHDPEPLRIEDIRHPTDIFTTTLETLEEGRRYRLTLLMKPDGPSGRHSQDIVLKTSSRSQPTIAVAANTLLLERVYTFPDEVDFGTLRLSDLERSPELLQELAQTLMVYQFAGKDFRVKVRTDLPQLELRSERGPQEDRYQNTLTLIREKLKTGTIRGSIFIETNDPEFQSLVVPVLGNIVP
jgi:Protein of unknown function (DUF1573)